MVLGGSNPRQLISQLDRLTEDYCRLFVGPVGHLPPIQSVWTAGELQSSVVGQLTEFVRICRYNSPWPELLPDHLANELQLMAVILEKASLESNATNTQLACSMTDAYFRQHLTWTGRLLERVQSIDGDGFYGNLAGLTQSFLDEEATTDSAALTDTSLAPTGQNS
jgi:TorA maturation chaperone TorD